jgi:hypothetical protein
MLHTEICSCIPKFIGWVSWAIFCLEKRNSLVSEGRNFIRHYRRGGRMLNPTFLCELAFLTDITKHMNDLNMKLQGKQRNVSNLFEMDSATNWSCSKLPLRGTTSLSFRAVKNKLKNSATMKVQTFERLFQTSREWWKNFKHVSLTSRSWRTT